jgi:hypothetical protein
MYINNLKITEICVFLGPMEGMFTIMRQTEHRFGLPEDKVTLIKWSQFACDKVLLI